MRKYVEFLLEDGETLLFEVDTDEEADLLAPTRAGISEKVPERAIMTFEAAMQKVKPAAEIIIKKLRGLVDPPDEVEIEFGIKFSADAGAVVAAAGIEANYTVTLKWKRDSKATAK